VCLKFFGCVFGVFLVRYWCVLGVVWVSFFLVCFDCVFSAF